MTAPDPLPCEVQTMPPPCEHCQGEGRVYRQAPTWDDPFRQFDDGLCPTCKGTGDPEPEEPTP